MFASKTHKLLRVLNTDTAVVLGGFSIGFFYQFGISCDVDRNKALELYLLAENNGKNEYCLITLNTEI